jgi:hypothetical protein
MPARSTNKICAWSSSGVMAKNFDSSWRNSTPKALSSRSKTSGPGVSMEHPQGFTSMMAHRAFRRRLTGRWMQSGNASNDLWSLQAPGEPGWSSGRFLQFRPGDRLLRGSLVEIGRESSDTASQGIQKVGVASSRRYRECNVTTITTANSTRARTFNDQVSSLV